MATTKLLVSDVASTVKNVPSNYIRPIYDRPNLSDVHISSEASIPLIDLHQLSGPRRSHVIKQIGLACQHDGFFQVYIYVYILLLIKLICINYSLSHDLEL